MDFERYVAAAGPGAGVNDLVKDPLLRPSSGSAPGFGLAADSPARDRGTASPHTGRLTLGCDGAPSHYCGEAPEPGAFELLDGCP
jgi:hypothetical protein